MLMRSPVATAVREDAIAILAEARRG